MSYVNAKQIMQKAFENGYAIPAINTNNLEWTKAILTTAQEQNSPIIIGTSEGAVKYMGGYKTIADMVKDMIEEFKITVPVVLHLDHGTYEGAFKALAAGYSSVMFDGSHLPIAENIAKSKEVVAAAAKVGASVEVEVGTLAGEEDGTHGAGDRANPQEVAMMSKIGPDMIAAGINNIHGVYPPGWTGLDFGVLSQLKAAAMRPLVLHGGTGIPTDQIKKSISMGVAKINVNTELQLSFAAATREFVRSGKSDEGKNFDPRKLLNPGYLAIKETIKEKMEIFGSVGKA